MALNDILFFGLGIALLIAGAWVLISGGTRVAAVLGIPPVVVGLTVVAFGTSAPELFVSILGAVEGSTGLVLGNVIGSNVANLGLILAAAALIRPVLVEKGLSRNELPFMLISSIAFAAMVWDGSLGQLDAAALVVGFVVFIVWTFRNLERGCVVPMPTGRLAAVPVERRRKEIVTGSGLVGLGVVGLAGGGYFIVDSASRLALGLGVSETVVGLTMVAIGTSLPELATTIVAALRNEDDLALGNIVGSNLFNILAVAGPVGLFKSLAVEGPQLPLANLLLSPTPNQVQLVTMVLLAAVVFIMIILGRGRIGRFRGLVLLALYGLTMYIWTM